eukprot:gene34639-41945_t
MLLVLVILVLALSFMNLTIESLARKQSVRHFAASLRIWAKKAPLSTAALVPKETLTPSEPTPKKKRSDKKLPKEGHFSCKPTDEFNKCCSVQQDYKFRVHGEPIALSRHRVTRGGIMYNPSAKFQADFLSACTAYLPATPLEGGIAVNMVFLFSRPKHHYGTGKNADVLKSTADLWHTKRSDIDNLAKFVLDALNSVAYKDDSQVCVLHTTKIYTDTEPGVEVHIKKLGEGVSYDAVVQKGPLWM